MYSCKFKENYQVQINVMRDCWKSKK